VKTKTPGRTAARAPGPAPHVTKEEVHAAADAVLVQFRRAPSVKLVFDKLEHGGWNTVNKHLRSWWYELPMRLKLLRAEAIIDEESNEGSPK
jgi:hypothetical protein